MKIRLPLLAVCSAVVALSRVGAFDNPNIAGQPTAGLVQGADGNFYGTTAAGGANSLGTVFQVTPSGQLTTLINFTGKNTAANRGDTPVAALIFGSDGNLYGTTQGGGQFGFGTVFRMARNGSGFATLIDFTGSILTTDSARGAYPSAALYEDPSALGTFYGTTFGGGVSSNGTVFKLVGTTVTSYDFSGATNGKNPQASLIKARDGFFYGTASSGGTGTQGVLFKFDPTLASATAITSFHVFVGAEGSMPLAEVIQGTGTDSSFYGATSAGGANAAGTIYSVNSTGMLTTIASFATTNGKSPRGGLTHGSGTDINFYGTTFFGGSATAPATANGTVYQILVTPSIQLKSIFSFVTDGNGNSPDGALPEGTLVKASDGFYYGTTSSGGAGRSGTVFRLGATGVTTLVSFNTPPPLAPVINSPLTASGQELDSFPNSPPTNFFYQITATNSPTLFGATGLPTGLSVNTTTGIISGDARVSGTFNVTISAQNAGGTDTKTLVLTIVPPKPHITSAVSASIQQGDTFTYQITASNNPTSFNAFTLPNGLSINTSNGVVSGKVLDSADNPIAGTFSFTIQATNAGGTDNKTFTLTVVAQAPVITSPNTATAQVGQTFQYQITATNFPTSYGAAGLPSGLTVNTLTGVISGQPDFTGDYNIQLSASNSGGTGTAPLALHVSTAPPPAPVVTSPNTATVTVGQSFKYQITADNNPTSYGAQNLPPGLTVNSSSGLISGTPSQEGTFFATVTATNAGGTGSRGVTFTINPVPPVITSPSSANAQVGQPFQFQITATNFPTSYGAQGLPPGLLLNTSNGVISGTPQFSGDSNIQLSASNSGGTGTQMFTLHVLPAAPVITSSSVVDGNQNQFLTFQVTATNNPTSYGAQGLPQGLNIDTATGLISGTPTDAGRFEATIRASNAGGSGTQLCTFRITPAPPVITSATTATATVNQEFAYQIEAPNSPSSYDAQGLPPGLTVDKLNGVIQGSPTASGTFNVRLAATNSGGTGVGKLTLTVRAVPPTITSSNTATGTQGQSFFYQIVANGNPTSYNATGLPASLSVDTNTGAISGTPTTTGKFAATISATNSGGTGTASLTITINPAPPGATPTPAPAKLANLSTRGPVEFGNDVMIGGFIIQGSASKQLAIRGIGPSLTQFGVVDALQDPTLSLRDPNGNELEFNDNYTQAPQSEQDVLQNNGLTPSDSREAAIVTTLPPGNYTAILRGKTGGIGLVEVYDISGNSQSQLVNISTRAKVEQGDNGAVIGGFIIQGGDAQRVVIRAIGPTLKNAGIADALLDPTLDLYRGSRLILSNDNWKSNSTADQQTLRANGLAPANDKEAALVTTLDPGNYEAVLRGKGNTTGVALAEVYQLNQ